LITKQLDPNISLEEVIRDRPQLVELLREKEAVNLMITISRFSEVLRDAYVGLEPNILVWYLFSLCDATSKAIKVLPVKGVEKDFALARLVMFSASRSILRQGFRALGLTPLDQM
jgi:arginyl-tRNA synthetase